MKSSSSLKPQDILILLKLIVWKTKIWRQVDLAHELALSPAEVVNALERLRKSQLIDPSKKKPYRMAAMELLTHGVRYVFPAEIGPIVRGIPTAHSAPPLSHRLVADETNQFVWPSEGGETRGMAISPLYESAPLAAKKDTALHELLALIDSLRIGRPREQKLAREELRKRILPSLTPSAANAP